MRRRRLRSQVAAFYERRLRRGRELSIDATRPAVVFAPHPDDETLGCGGTIARMSEAGVAVKVVIMTDGGCSHRQLMPEDALVRLRAREVAKACEKLGVGSRDLCLLGFPDGRLSAHHEEAVARVVGILGEHQPADVFIPYRNDAQADHAATTAIVEAAIVETAGARSRPEVSVYEYPVWFLHQWPFVNFDSAGEGNLVSNLLRTAVGNYRLLRDFNVISDVTATLLRKCEALDEHRSQMQRLVPDDRWPVLSDVADGAFLARFTRPFELFCAR